MKKVKLNLPFIIGLLLLAVTRIADHYLTVPFILFNVLSLTALVFEIWGVVLIARSPEMKSSKLRQWKLGLLGKVQKQK